MGTPLHQKSTLEDIRSRFDNDVERFSNLETGQQTTIDAPLAAELITQNAVATTPNAKKVLDIGCGAGNNTLRLLQLLNPLDCDLVDLSQPMLDSASKRITAVNSGKIRTFQEDIRTAALPEAHYDIILAAAVLHHLRDEADWETTFSKIYQLTAPGGSFWITDLVSHESSFVQKTMWNRYGEYIESLGGEAYRAKVFAYIELRKVGFVEVDILHKNSCFAAFGARKRLSCAH